MTRHCTHHLALLSLLAMATVGCAASSPRVAPAGTHAARLSPMARYFDALEIRRTGATTAWDALRFLAPNQRLQEVGPLGTRRPPTTSGSGLSGLPAPRVVLDGFALVDPSALRAMPASDIVDMQLLGSSDAMMFFGPGYGGGAVVIRTVRGLGRRDR